MNGAPSPKFDFATWRDDALVAIGFLTRLPIRISAPFSEGALARASWAFPIVGLLVGIVGWLAYRTAAALGLPALVDALLAVGLTILLTGGLHEDGLADTADGLGGGATRDAKLAIMRDSRNGTYGVLVLIFSVGLRTAALAALGGNEILGALVAAHATARGALPLVMHRLDPARSDGLGAMAGRPALGVSCVAAGLGAVMALAGIGAAPGVVAIPAAAAGMLLVALLAQRALSGYTGDVLGAIEQTGEIIMLLAASTWLS
jgi:adenosylcobinamide-GDP ribazoletransferase